MATTAEPKTYEELLAENERLRVQYALIYRVAKDAIEHSAAFGSELRLAQRILAVLEHRL